MPSALPLFVFGLGITLLVGLGVFLALREFRSAHPPLDAMMKDVRVGPR
jgi:hypothetical protein